MTPLATLIPTLPGRMARDASVRDPAARDASTREAPNFAPIDAGAPAAPARPASAPAAAGFASLLRQQHRQYQHPRSQPQPHAPHAPQRSSPPSPPAAPAPPASSAGSPPAASPPAATHATSPTPPAPRAAAAAAADASTEAPATDETPAEPDAPAGARPHRPTDARDTRAGPARRAAVEVPADGVEGAATPDAATAAPGEESRSAESGAGLAPGLTSGLTPGLTPGLPPGLPPGLSLPEPRAWPLPPEAGTGTLARPTDDAASRPSAAPGVIGNPLPIGVDAPASPAPTEAPQRPAPPATPGAGPFAAVFAAVVAGQAGTGPSLPPDPSAVAIVASEGAAGLAPLAAVAPSAVPAGAMDGTATTVAIATPVAAPDFAHALGLQLSVLATRGVQRAELHLNPAEMGPVSVQIVIDGAQAHIHFGADLAATRQAIEASLPELAGALRDTGLTLAGGGVSQQSQGRGEAPADGGARRHTGSTESDAADASPGLADAHGAASRRRVAAGGVDLYA